MIRIGVAAISQESGSFLGQRTTIENFRRSTWVHGSPTEAHVRNSTELGGVMSVLDECSDVAPVPFMAAIALPWGPLTDEAYNTVLEIFETELSRAGPLDALCLVLHGALASEYDPDVDGTILSCARRCSQLMTIGASLDSHAHVTETMVTASDVLTTYRTVPHVDQYETGARMARLVVAAARGEINPTMARHRVPMITPAEKHDTSQQPMSALMATRDQLDARPGVLDCSLAHVQPWLDVPDLGWVAVAITDGDLLSARKAAKHLATAAWELRQEFLVEKVEPAEAVARCARSEGPIVVSDAGDSTGGGAAGDSTVLLRALLDASVRPRSLITVTDPSASQRAHEVGVDGVSEFVLGAWSGSLAYSPITLTARVHSLPAGDLVVRGPSQTGVVMTLGQTAVLQVEELTIVVSEHGLYNLDPSLFEQLGIEPRTFQLIHTKSPAGYRAGYAELAPSSISMRSPGATTSDFNELPWRNITRPLFPLDPDARMTEPTAGESG